MNGLTRTRKLLSASLCLGMLSVIGLGGCSVLPHTTSRTELAVMPAGEALKQMRSDVDSWERSGWAADLASGMVDARLKSLAEAYSANLKSLNEDIEAQIKSANTPAKALREMVEDVSVYVLDKFPRHAEALGLTEYRLNVAMGDLINKNNDERLRGALAMIKSNLVNNHAFTNQFRLLAVKKSEQQAIVNDINGGNTAIFDNPEGIPDYIDPKYTYVIQGTSWITREGYLDHKLTVYTQIDSMHVGENETAGSILLERSYFYHPIDEGFITEAENDRRAALSSKN